MRILALLESHDQAGLTMLCISGHRPLRELTSRLVGP